MKFRGHDISNVQAKSVHNIIQSRIKSETAGAAYGATATKKRAISKKKRPPLVAAKLNKASTHAKKIKDKSRAQIKEEVQKLLDKPSNS